jgi:Tfp pilus assembly protein PilN
MIEINLVPDVKQEFLKAKRVRTVVISTAVLVGLASIAIVALLAVYAFLGQTVRSSLADSEIKDKSAQLAKVEDLGKTLTIQHQLEELSEIHNGTNVMSRFFEMLAAINPSAPNQVTFSMARVDAETNSVRLEGQAVNGFNAADTLKKTILSTTLSYRDETNEMKTLPLAQSVALSELSYGEDSTGRKVLRFTLTFDYDPAFFSPVSRDAVIVPPNRQNVTDSFLRLPESLFGDRIDEEKEGSN